jgi:hypothetical protein
MPVLDAGDGGPGFPGAGGADEGDGPDVALAARPAPSGWGGGAVLGGEGVAAGAPEEEPAGDGTVDDEGPQVGGAGDAGLRLDAEAPASVEGPFRRAE